MQSFHDIQTVFSFCDGNEISLEQIISQYIGCRDIITLSLHLDPFIMTYF